jgi:hypothetical protein
MILCVDIDIPHCDIARHNKRHNVIITVIIIINIITILQKWKMDITLLINVF